MYLDVKNRRAAICPFLSDHDSLNQNFINISYLAEFYTD